MIEVPEARLTRPQPGLGKRIKALRLSRGLTLKQVAARTGLSSSYLSLVETGRNEPTVGRLLTLAGFYEVGIADLIPDRSTDQPVALRRDDRPAFAFSVLSGELMVNFADRSSVVLREGDSVWFEGSRQRHGDGGDREAQVINFKNETHGKAEVEN